MQKRLGWRFDRRLSIASAIEPPSDNQRYARRVLTIAPNNFVGYWPMWERGDTIAWDRSPQGNNGVYVGTTQDQPGIGDGRTSQFFDGANDYNDIYSVALDADFNRQEGTCMIWARVVNVGAWTDGVLRYMVRIQTNGNNLVRITKHSLNNQIQFQYYANAVGQLVTRFGSNEIDWMNLAITWSKTADEVRAYFNGLQTGLTQNGLNVWAGALSVQNTVIGSAATAPGVANVWNGWLAHCAVWNTPLTPAQVALLYVGWHD